VIKHAHLRKGFTPQNVEDAFRMTLLYSVNTYKGDEKIKSFVWDLITPKEYGDKVTV
jgi:chromodomain-helicase-DNA-binding protein 7